MRGKKSEIILTAGIFSTFFVPCEGKKSEIKLTAGILKQDANTRKVQKNTTYQDI